MAMQIEADATVSELGQQEASGGKRGGKRHRWGMALIAALVLGLGALAGAAVGQLRTGEPVASVPAPIAVAAPWTGTCRTGSVGCEPDEALIPGVPRSAPAPAQRGPGWTDARDYAPAAPATTSGGQQAELYAIEVRDNGAGTTGGDSGPCREPGRSCDR